MSVWNEDEVETFLVDYGDIAIEEAESVQSAISALLIGLQEQGKIRRWKIKE